MSVPCLHPFLKQAPQTGEAIWTAFGTAMTNLQHDTTSSCRQNGFQYPSIICTAAAVAPTADAAAASAAARAGRPTGWSAGWLPACLSSLIDGWHHSTMTSTLAYSQQSLHSVAPAHSVAIATMDIMTDINPARWHLIVSPEQADSISVFSRLMCIFSLLCLSA